MEKKNSINNIVRQEAILSLIGVVEGRLANSKKADKQLDQVIGMVNNSDGVAMTSLAEDVPEPIRSRLNKVLLNSGRQTLESVQTWCKDSSGQMIEKHLTDVMKTFRLPID